MPEPQTTTTEFFTPSVKAVKEAVEAAAPEINLAHVNLPDNLADEAKLVKKFHSASHTHFTNQSGAAERVELDERLQAADAMWRMSKRRVPTTKGDAKKDHDTMSNDASSQFYESIRLVSNAQKTIIFGDRGELPARYDPYLDSDDYGDEEGKRIADEQTRAFMYAYNKGKWERKGKKAITAVNRDSLGFFSLEWERKTRTSVERVPGFYDIDGQPREYNPKEPQEMFDAEGVPIQDFTTEDGKPKLTVFVEKTRVIKDCPEFNRLDMKKVNFDFKIAELQNQSCITIRDQWDFSDILDKQKQGEWKNVERLTNAQLFESDSENGSTIATDRDDDADYDKDDGENGLYDVYHVWMKAPINTSKKKAEWDKGAIPEIYEAIFVGKEYGTLANDPSNENDKKANGGVVCVLLRKNPYNHGRFPYNVVYSHDDDRKPLNMGYQTLMECNVEEQTVTLRQHIDNKTLGIKRPWVGERGNVLSRDLLFRGGNDIKWVKPGTGKTALTQLDVTDFTNTTIPFLDWLRGTADKIMGTTDAFKGEFAGSRTTGTEYLGAKEQALKPAIEDAKFIADQLFDWLLPDVAELFRQFGDPEKMIQVTQGTEMLGTFSPGSLYGDLQTKVVSIEKFEKDLSAKQVLINFLQAGAYEQSKEFMGKTGGLHFWRTLGEAVNLPDIQTIYPEIKKNKEAENQAFSDYKAILFDPAAAMQDEALLPKEGEEHEVHISVLTPVRDRWELMANVESDPEKKEYANMVVQALKLYILMHEQFVELEAQQDTQAQVAQQATEQPQGAGFQSGSDVPGFEGEAAGDTLAGVTEAANVI